MRKFTLFLALMVAMVTTTMAQNYSLTTTRLTSSELNSKTEPTLIAIKNLSKTNNYWFVGNTGAAPYSAAEFSNAAVFVWEPVVEGVAGVYCLKKLDGTYMTSASPTTFSAESGSGALFTTTNPTTDNGGFNGDGDTQYDDQALFVRFVTGDKWINVQNGDTGTPVYNTGTGGWTLHNVYLVEELAEGEEPAAPIPSFQQALADVTAKEITEFPAGVSTAKEAEETGENCGIGVVKQAVQNVKVTTPCEMTVNFQYTGGAHKLVVLGVDLVDAEGAVVAQDYHYGFTGGAAKDNTYTLDGTALATGSYTLRYFFCHKANDHEVGNQTASITVNGLEYTITLPEGVVADPSELKSTALYTIVPRASGRGVVYANAESTHLTTTALANANSADVNQQFMFVENEGKMYLYSVGAGKFVNDEGKYLNLTAEPDHFVTVEKGDGAGYMFINMNGVDKVNVSTGWNYGALADWNTADDGNNLRITYVDEASQATLDALDAIFNPAPAEPVTFDIYSLDDNMNPSLLEGTVSKLGYVVFAASDNNAVLAEAADAPKVCIFDPAMGGAVAEASSIMFGDLLDNGMQLVAVQFDGFATPGTYMVYAPAGAFTVNGQPSEEIISAQFTIPAPVVKVFEVESVTPANGAEVEAIEKIEINFTENITLQQNPATWDFYTVNLVDENNNVIELTTSDDTNVWSKAVFTPAEPITAAGTYTLDLSQIKLDGGVCEGSYSWTVVAPAAEPGIDTSKEYYLYSSYNWGMNKGYLTIGTKSGSNYGPAYMANEKQQSFKLTPAADGGYTLSREADMGGMSWTEYIDCTHAYNVGNNADGGSVLYFELTNNNKYYIRSANGYFKADKIDYTTTDWAYHVFSNGDMTSAMEWELIPVEDVVDPEQPAAEPLNYVSHSPATVVESVSEVTITFDREVGSVSSDLSSVKLKLGTNVPARGMSSDINGNSVTIYLNSPVKSSGEYTLEIPADIIKAADGGAFAGTTLTIIVDAAPAMTSKASVTVDNTLSDIAVEFDSEIEFATGAEKLQLIVKGTETVAAEFVVGESAIIEGNVLTLTLAEEIAPEATTKYDLAIPADFIVKKGSDKAFAGKTITYTVKIPFAIKNFTPASGSTVEALENIVIEFNESVFDYNLNTLKLVNIADNSEVALTGVANGNILTLTPNEVVANGTYSLVNINNIVNNSYSPVAEAPEYTITVAASVVELEALEAVSADRNPLETAINGQYKLQGVKLNFDEVVKKYTTELTGDYGYILDAEGNEVAKLNKCMGGNGTSNNFATPYSATAIETPGTYKVVVLPGVILNADGTKEYKGGEFEFTVAERAVEVSPSAEEGFCYNETFENVADFSEFVITVKYAKSDVVINNEVKATMKTGETVYDATVTVEKSGNTQYITLAFNGDFAEGRYSVDVPAGLFTVDGVANEAYVQSTFTYRKPQLEISRDFDTWESYLDQVWYMPTAAMITIANAESVVVNEEVVATIAVGENVYNSTLNWYYDEWSNAYYIEYVFEDFLAEGFEFAKGDYTFTLPAGAYTVNGEANEEAVKVYTYGDPIVEEFSVTEILPASGSELESIDAISITFSNGMAADVLPVTCGEKTYNFVSMSGVYVPVDMNYEPIVITEPGTYTLDLSELEGLTGEKVFSWTIVEAVEEPVDYTPTYTGTVERNDRNVTAVTLGDNRYDLLTPEQSSCYVDATETVTFTVVAGATVKANVEHKGEWVHHSVYIDLDGDGFTSGLEEGSEWKPAGDLVTYSFYNNNGSSDEYGYNSVGTYMSDMDRHMPEMPEFVAPTEPGLYRIRFVQDWCSIDPNGDSDGKFGDFMGNGGQIVDVMLEVIEGTTDGIEEVETEAEKVIYDLTGRRILEITKSGIYVVNGKKVIVK